MVSELHNIRAKWLGFFAIKAEKDDHPNKLKFKGILLLTDEPSQKPPNGSRGHRIMIPKDVAEKNLHTLIGMGIDYEDSLDKHNPKKKIGVIQKAWMDGNKLMCSGIVWKKDFSSAAEAFDDDRLGMSFEGSNITVEDPKADVWKITDVCFTGAAILYKTAAAYQKTEALAAAADNGAAICTELVYKHNGGKAMAQKKEEHKQKKSRRSVSAANDESNVVSIDVITKALSKALRPVAAALQTQTSAIVAMSAQQEEFQSELLEQTANGAPGMLGKKGKKGASSSSASSSASSSESSEEAAASMSESSMPMASESAKGKKKVKAGADASSQEASADVSSQEGGASSDASDAGSLEDMDESDSVDSSSEAPGHLNKHANKNKGNKKTVSTKGDKHPKAEAGLHASASNKKLRKLVRQLAAERDQAIANAKKSKKKVKTLEAQAEDAANDLDRKSVPHLSAITRGVLEKGSIDLAAMTQNDEKLTVAQVDAILDKIPGVDVRQRMATKTELAASGVMDEGRVVPVQ